MRWGGAGAVVKGRDRHGEAGRTRDFFFFFVIWAEDEEGPLSLMAGVSRTR